MRRPTWVSCNWSMGELLRDLEEKSRREGAKNFANFFSHFLVLALFRPHVIARPVRDLCATYWAYPITMQPSKAFRPPISPQTCLLLACAPLVGRWCCNHLCRLPAVRKSRCMRSLMRWHRASVTRATQALVGECGALSHCVRSLIACSCVCCWLRLLTPCALLLSQASKRRCGTAATQRLHRLQHVTRGMGVGMGVGNG